LLFGPAIGPLPIKPLTYLVSIRASSARWFLVMLDALVARLL